MCVMFDRLIPGLFTWHNHVCAVGLLREFHRPPHPRREDIHQRLADNSVLVDEIISFRIEFIACVECERPIGD